MASDYLHRIERVEAAITPTNELHIVPVHDGQTNAGALAAYASVRGYALAEVCGPVVFLADVDLRL